MVPSRKLVAETCAVSSSCCAFSLMAGLMHAPHGAPTTIWSFKTGYLPHCTD